MIIFLLKAYWHELRRDLRQYIRWRRVRGRMCRCAVPAFYGESQYKRAIYPYGCDYDIVLDRDCPLCKGGEV